MPTYDYATVFMREYGRLTSQQKALYLAARNQMIADLKAHRPFSPQLRVKLVQGQRNVWEMTWDADGRATFNYGTPRQPGDVHIHWRRIGDHSILQQP